METTATQQTERAPHGAQLPAAAFTVPEFCAAHRISKALFYLLLRDGDGPRVMRARGRTLISLEAAAEWRRALEKSTTKQVAA